MWSLLIGHVVVCEGKSAASHALVKWRAAGDIVGPATASGNPSNTGVGQDRLGQCRLGKVFKVRHNWVGYQLCNLM